MKVGIYCSSNQYKYKGRHFEVHRYCGPSPLNSEGDPTNEILLEDHPFWVMWEEFQKEVDKEQWLTYNGGCKTF